MTKEDLIKKVTSFCRQWMASREVDDLEELLNEFFSQNVVIPKGKNRHPYADIISEKLFNNDLQVQQWYKDGWVTWCITDGIDWNLQYRIKPYEPVYEWQFEFIDKEFKIVTSFMTDEELIQKRESGEIPKKVYIKKPETKRERKF